MKKRSIILGSTIILAVLLVAGTMAWFTAEAEVTNTFTAGTVKIDVNESGQVTSAEPFKNLNPGDTVEKKVTVKSTGSKAT